MKRVLLTGCGGSIGIHVLAHFMTNTDWHIVGTDSFRHKGWTDRLAVHFKAHPEHLERFTLITHDLTVPFSELTKKRIGHIDYIVNLASLSDVEASIKDPVTFVRNNVELVTNLLEYAREINPEAFIQFSTDEVYGPTPSKAEVYPEWASIRPSNPYAASKACQEAVAIAYWRTYKVPVVITNTMNNFGEMQQPSKYPVMIQKWIAKGEKITVHGQEGDIGSRSYIHSRNTADAVLYILKNLPPYMHDAGTADEPDRYNMTGDKQIDNLELVKLIATLMGKEADYELVDFHSTRPGHDKHYGLDGSKLAKLGWKSPVSFEESLKNTIDWQMKNPEWIN